MDLRGRVRDQFDRANVEAVELRGHLLEVIERPGRRRHVITVYNSVMPRAMLRLRNAVERYGWLQPDSAAG